MKGFFMSVLLMQKKTAPLCDEMKGWDITIQDGA
jgi:hypothetical protein